METPQSFLSQVLSLRWCQWRAAAKNVNILMWGMFLCFRWKSFGHANNETSGLHEMQSAVATRIEFESHKIGINKRSFINFTFHASFRLNLNSSHLTHQAHLHSPSPGRFFQSYWHFNKIYIFETSLIEAGLWNFWMRSPFRTNRKLFHV